MMSLISEMKVALDGGYTAIVGGDGWVSLDVGRTTNVRPLMGRVAPEPDGRLWAVVDPGGATTWRRDAAGGLRPAAAPAFAREGLMTDAADIWSAPIPDGYQRNHRGDLVHERNISAADLDQDGTVARIHQFGRALSAQMARYREHTLGDIMELRERVIGRYNGKLGGGKGNITLTSFDGCRRVILSQAEHVEVGPEIEAAQALVDECLDEWAERSHLKLRALVTQAFRPASSDGRLSVSRLLGLRRVEIDDDRWRRAQLAIADALRPRTRSEYVRLYRRATPDKPWEQIPLHLATVRSVEDASAPADQLALRVRSAVAEALRGGMTRSDIRSAVAAARDLALRDSGRGAPAKRKGGGDACGA